jgi:cell division protein FtsB
MPPGLILLQLVSFALPIGAVAFFGWLGLRYVRARERDVSARLDSVRQSEVARLQDTVLALQTEVQTLRERQDFVEKLLERPRPERGSV